MLVPCVYNTATKSSFLLSSTICMSWSSKLWSSTTFSTCCTSFFSITSWPTLNRWWASSKPHELNVHLSSLEAYKVFILNDHILLKYWTFSVFQGLSAAFSGKHVSTCLPAFSGHAQGTKTAAKKVYII